MMAQTYDPPDPLEVNDFKFLQLRKLKLILEGETVPQDAINLIAASSRFGLIFAAFSGGFKVLKLENILDLDEDRDKFRVPSEEYLYQKVACQEPVLLSLSSDDMTLAVCMDVHGCPVADMYDIRAFADQDNSPKPFLRVQLSSSPAKLLDFMWNPVVVEMYAFCLSDGTLHVHEVNDTALNILASVPSSAGASSVCWSPKGKQLVVGNVNGSFSQYKPNLQEVKKIPPPNLNGGNVQVINICWLATTTFAVLYLPPDDKVPSLVVVSTPKGAAIKYTVFGDICLGFGQSRQPRYMMHHQSEWGILMCSSANAVETAVIGSADAAKSLWVPWALEDGGRAEVPLEKYTETYPLGMDVIFCAQRRIVLSEMEAYPPMPIVFLLSTCGILCPFHVLNKKAGVRSIVYPSEAICCEGERKGKELQPAFSTPQKSSSSFSVTPTPNVTTLPPPLNTSMTPPLNMSAQPPPSQQPVSNFGSTLVKTPQPLGANQTKSPFAFAKPEPTFVSPFAQKNSFSPVVNQNATSMPVFQSVVSSPNVPVASLLVQPEAKCPSVFPYPGAVIFHAEPDLTNVEEVQPSMAKDTADNNKKESLGTNLHMAVILEEIQNFNKEMEELKSLSNSFNVSIGTKNEFTEIKKKGLLMKEFQNDMVDTMQSLNLDIHNLKTMSLESFGHLGEANSRNIRRNDPKYLSILRDRTLDPMMEKRMEKIHQVHQYLNLQLQEVHDKIDRDWVERMDKEKNKQRSKLRIPSTQAIYQTVVNNQNIIFNLKNLLDELCKKTNKLKLNRISLAGQFSKQQPISSEGDLGKLADSFLQDKASVSEVAKNTYCKKLPSNVQNALRNAMLNHSIVCVRSKTIASPSQSQLLSSSVSHKQSPKVKSPEHTEARSSVKTNSTSFNVEVGSKTPADGESASVPNRTVLSTPPHDLKPLSFNTQPGQTQNIGRITQGTPVAKPLPNSSPQLASLLAGDRKNLSATIFPSKSPSAFTQFTDSSVSQSQTPFAWKTIPGLQTKPNTSVFGQTFANLLTDKKSVSIDSNVTVPPVVKPTASSSLFTFPKPVYEDISPPSSPVCFQEVGPLGEDISVISGDELTFFDKVKDISEEILLRESNFIEKLSSSDVLITESPRGISVVSSPLLSNFADSTTSIPFGQPVSTTSPKSTFGQVTSSTPIGLAAAIIATPPPPTITTTIGQTSNAVSPSSVQTPTTTNNLFGQKVYTSGAPTQVTHSTLATSSSEVSNTTVTTSSSIQATGTENVSLLGQSSAAASPFSQVTSTSAVTSPFGQPAGTTGFSPFGLPVITTTTAAAGVTSPFGLAAITATTTAAESTTSPFGLTANSENTAPTTAIDLTANSATTTAPTSPFGLAAITTTTAAPTSPFGLAAITATTTAPTSPFGLATITTTTAATVSSPFGIAASTATTALTSPFGQSASTTTVTSPFGQIASTAGVTSPFGQSATSSSFGQPSSPFGQTITNTSAFGQSAGASSFFGAASPNGTPAFGQSEQQKSVFGAPSAASFSFNKTAFGTTTPNNSFGLTKAVFGQPTNQPSSPFDQTSPQPVFGQNAFSGLGGKPTEQNASKNVFSLSNITQDSNKGSLFGNQGGSVFGSKPGSFSGGSFSTSGGSVGQSGFGAFQQTPQKPGVGVQFQSSTFQGGFGSPSAFGGSATFSGSPSFGSSPTFGSGPAAAAGSGSLFGSSQSGFSSFASADAPTFGSLASQTGASGGFGNMQPQQQQQPQGGMFGSPVFGGNGGNAFGGQPQQQQQQSVFGSPNAGNQSAFSQWRS